MPNRYKNKKINIDNAGKRHYKTTINPNIPLDSSDILMVARFGDRLDILANRFYKNTSYWWIIAEANGLGKGSLYIKPGTQVRIPRNLSNITKGQDNINKGR